MQWTEAVVCAVLTGLAADAAWRPRRLTLLLPGPALVFGDRHHRRHRREPWRRGAETRPRVHRRACGRISHAEHFVDVRGFPAIFTGLRLLEGVLLFALAARLSLDAASLRTRGCRCRHRRRRRRLHEHRATGGSGRAWRRVLAVALGPCRSPALERPLRRFQRGGIVLRLGAALRCGSGGGVQARGPIVPGRLPRSIIACALWLTSSARGVWPAPCSAPRLRRSPTSPQDADRRSARRAVIAARRLRSSP